MTSLLPISSACHALQLPPTEKDDRLNLNVRTGSASTLFNSNVFTAGGLTIGLDLPKITIAEILAQFASKLTNSKPKNIVKYLTGELFHLSLIERVWSRVHVVQTQPKPPPRLFHEMAAVNNCIYIFGGLVVNAAYNLSDHSSVPSIDNDLLIPSNDLWEFNLETNSWCLLDDGTSANSPLPRYCFKMTSINSLKFVNKKDHFGLLIAGGKDSQSLPVYDNAIFDLVERRYVGTSDYKLNLSPSASNPLMSDVDLNNIANTDDNYNINVDYFNSFIVNMSDNFTHFNQPKKSQSATQLNKTKERLAEQETTKSSESIIVYTPVKASEKASNPLLSFNLGKTIKNGKILPMHRKNGSDHKNIVPYNLRYPTVGLFGQNLIITGFLPNDLDISVFIFNKPTGKWSRLNVFCNHDYGSHRFWGGYTWRSHHKVVLIGNYVTSRTTSSIRYFTCLITVDLPIANILASSELEGGGHFHDASGKRIYFDEIHRNDDSTDSVSMEKSSSETELQAADKNTAQSESRRPSYASRGSRGSVSTTKSPRAISFSEYVHYAAPTTNFTTIRSVFPPAAITLGRNFLDRFGDLTSDFELISAHGDRIPVSLMVLIERWGRYFIELLARGYVNAVEKFEKLQKGEIEQGLFSKGSSTASSGKNVNILKSSFASSHGSSISSETEKVPKRQESEEPKDRTFHIAMPQPPKKLPKEAPQFRLPFQENSSKSSLEADHNLPPDAKSTLMMSHTSSEGSQTSQSSQLGPKSIVDIGGRKDSVSSHSSGHSLLTSHLQDIPPQPPLPSEPIPAVPASQSFRTSSRKNSSDLSSPRGSLIATLTALRNIPLSKSPRGSPFASPRASISQQGGLSPASVDQLSSALHHTKLGPQTPEGFKGKRPIVNDMSSTPSLDLLDTDSSNVSSQGTPKSTKHHSGTASPSSDRLPDHDGSFSLPDHSDGFIDRKEDAQAGNAQIPSDNNFFDNILLNFENLENGTFQMESSLIPRKLYFPFGTSSAKAFCEYLYTGQIGNKWLLTPTTMDNLCISKFFKVPLLYDLICEVLYGVIGRRESWVVKRANELKKAYFKLLEETNTPRDHSFVFPLDEYEGFMDTIDDGYLDLTLLKKTTRLSKGASILSEKRRRSHASENRSSVHSEKRKLHVGEGKTAPDDSDESEKEVDRDEHANEDSVDTEDTFDKVVSSDDDQHLSYMGFKTEPANVGPRSKSVFDRSDFDSHAFRTEEEHNEDDHAKYFENSTLEMLVSPRSPIPCERTMDVIYESVCLVGDLKLMLRANNAKNMGTILKQFEVDLEEKMDHIKMEYDERQKQPQRKVSEVFQSTPANTDLSQVLTQQISRVPPLVKNNSSDGDYALRSVSLKPVGSSSSLSLVTTETNLSEAPQTIERTKSSTSFRALSGLAPFKSTKTEPRLGLKHTNSDHMQQAPKNKKEEKQKKKEAAKYQKELRRSKTSVLSLADHKHSDQLSLKSVDSDAKKKQHHAFFHSIGSHLKTKGSDTALESGAKLARSQSPTISINSNVSKASDSKKGSTLFGLKKQ